MRIILNQKKFYHSNNSGLNFKKDTTDDSIVSTQSKSAEVDNLLTPGSIFSELFCQKVKTAVTWSGTTASMPIDKAPESMQYPALMHVHAALGFD